MIQVCRTEPSSLSPLEVECSNGIRKYQSENDNEAEKYSRRQSNHVVSESVEASQVLFNRLIVVRQNVFHLSVLRYNETVQGVGHGICPVVPSPPYGNSLSIHNVIVSPLFQS